MKGSDLIDCGRASRACGADAGTIKRWLGEDGASLHRRKDGLFLHWNDLRKCLSKRGLPIPPSLDRGTRVLVVDDDPDILLFLVEELTDALDRPQIATASNGRDALRKLRRLRPDLLVTDLEMPVMGGLELCRLVRLDPRFDRMKILAVTGFDEAPMRWQAGASGADRYLAKPFTLKKLRREVSRLLSAPMKKIMMAALLLVAGCGALRADPGDFGAGLILGSPFGVTAKYFITNTHAVDAGVGDVADDFTAYADYLWHAWDIFPKPKEGRFEGYLGLGGQLRDARHTDDIFGLRTVAGAGYWVQGAPIEIFAELVPVIELSPNDFVQLDGGIGARYYFGRGATANKK